MDAVGNKTQILDVQAVYLKIKRMALEIAERNLGEGSIVLAGITGNGVAVSKLLAAELKEITGTPPELLSISLDKTSPSEVSYQPSIALEDSILVITDDVSNTGRTMFYALKPFFNQSLKKIQTAVLVERSHKLFPVQTDYTGLSISTTLQEHIEVTAVGEAITGAWLY